MCLHTLLVARAVVTQWPLMPRAVQLQMSVEDLRGFARAHAQIEQLPPQHTLHNKEEPVYIPDILTIQESKRLKGRVSSHRNIVPGLPFAHPAAAADEQYRAVVPFRSVVHPQWSTSPGLPRIIHLPVSVDTHSHHLRTPFHVKIPVQARAHCAQS
jgi:hypothetical protein